MTNGTNEVNKKQKIIHDSDVGRIVIMDSITWADERNNSNDVLIGASFAGIISVRFPLRVNPKGVICHEAGIGKNNAGINGLYLLEGKGIPAAAVETMSAGLGDGNSMYHDGVISVMNDSAKKIGVEPGMTVKEAALKLLMFRKPIEKIEKYQEVVYESALGRVMAMETVTFIDETNNGDVICAGSHSGVTSAAYSSRFNLKGVICNDGGLAKNQSGISGLKILDEHAIPSCAVDSMSAMIGDGVSTYKDGVISAVNNTAQNIGIDKGMKADAAALLMLKHI